MSTPTIYFITEQYLKINTPITANVDIIEILPLVKNAAIMWSAHTLGTYFFEDLLAKYNAMTLNSDETYLVELMQPSIAWRTCSDAVLELSYQLKNKGVQTQSGDFSAAAELKAVQYLSETYGKKAEFYENRMWQYLRKNKALFPAFTNPLNHDSYLINTWDDENRDTFTSSINLF